MKLFVLIAAGAMYTFVIAFPNKKAWCAVCAGLAMLISGFFSPVGITLHEAASELINWNVLMIYIGSMTIAALFIYSRVPARIADMLIERVPNTGCAIVAILAMTGIISIFVENVATVLVMAPIALALCKKLSMNPTLFMAGLAVMSNLEGTATLVGDPPSMIFASFAGWTFNDFFIYNGRLSIFFVVQTGMLSGCMFFYMYFARCGKSKAAVKSEHVISFVPALLLLAMIGGLAAVSFIKNPFPCLSGFIVIALAIAGMLWFSVCQRKSAKEVFDMLCALDWETIFFLIGIFVVVGAVSKAGLLDDFSAILAIATGGHKFAGFLLILLSSVVISGFIDNVPYIIAMLPVSKILSEHLGLNPQLYMFALLVGSCLGGNLTPFGASANVVAMGILKKEGFPMRFCGWLKIGLPFTLITTTAAAAVLWLIWA